PRRPLPQTGQPYPYQEVAVGGGQRAGRRLYRGRVHRAGQQLGLWQLGVVDQPGALEHRHVVEDDLHAPLREVADDAVAGTRADLRDEPEHLAVGRAQAVGEDPVEVLRGGRRVHLGQPALLLVGRLRGEYDVQLPPDREHLGVQLRTPPQHALPGLFAPRALAASP